MALHATPFSTGLASSSGVSDARIPRAPWPGPPSGRAGRPDAMMDRPSRPPPERESASSPAAGAGDDAHVLLLLRQGDERAFRLWVGQMQDRVFATCLHLLGTRQEAEDAAQEAFVEAYRAIGAFSGRARLSTWMYRIAVNKAMEHLRRRHRRKRFARILGLFGLDGEPHPEIVDSEHPGVLAEDRERAHVLYQALDRLSPAQRAAFVLCKIDGRPVEEAAAILSSTPGAVESLVHRAKTGLRRTLRAYYEDAPPPTRPLAHPG